MVFRRTVLGASAGAAALLTASPRVSRADSWSDEIMLVADGVAASTIIIPDSSTPIITAAADDLVRYIERSSGASIPIVPESEAGTVSAAMARIYLGLCAPGHETVMDTLADKGPWAFTIKATPGLITLNGNSLMGQNGVTSRFAASELLERHIGVRWLLPSQIGFVSTANAWEDVPSHQTIGVPVGEQIHAPAFELAQYSGVRDGTWIYRNRNAGTRLDGSMSGASVQFSDLFTHKLHTIFDSAIWGDTHPEIYPTVDGRREIPAPGKTSGWQPSFTEPITIDIAADWVIDYFNQSADVIGVSLGVNDGVSGFCELDEINPGFTTARNSFGYMDLSDVYYRWLNAVVERVALVHPDKKIGCLAYYFTVDPPSFALHPNVVPVVATESYGWLDPDRRALDQARFIDWLAKASEVGWWDYPMGSPYAVPRMFNHQLQQAYAWAADAGVKYIYAQAATFVGEGPKQWIYTKLLWDPHVDVDALQAEWCDRAAGHQGGPILSQYFDLWERHATHTLARSDWFATGKDSTYFGMNDASHLTELSASVVTRAAALLDLARSRASTSAQEARIDMIAEAFHEYTKLAWQSYPPAAAVPTTTAAAMALVDRIEDSWRARETAAEKRVAWINANATDGTFNLNRNPLSYGMYWSGWSADELFALVDHIREYESLGGPVRGRLGELAEDTDRLGQFCRLAIGISTGTLAGLMVNPSFEDGETGPWVMSHGQLSGGQWHLDTTRARTGATSASTAGIHRGYSRQTVPISGPGMVVCEAWISVAGKGYWDRGFAYPRIQFRSNGTTVRDQRGAQTQVDSRESPWQRISMLQVVPAAVDGQPIDAVDVMFEFWRLGDQGGFHLDDLNVFYVPQS